MNMNRKKLIGYTIMILIPTIFLLVILALLSFPLMLIALMLLIIAVGILYRSKPDLFALLFKKKDDAPVLIQRQKEPIQYPRHNKAYLMLIGINASHQHCITMDKVSFIIGRDATCNYVLDDPMVSRRHLTLEFHEDDGLCYVQDTSSNGTYLNSTKLRNNQSMPLKQGDVLQIANTAFSVEYVHF